MIKFTVPGPPEGKARPRVTRNGTYTPKKTRIYEKKVQGYYSIKHGGKEPIRGYIRATITAYYPLVKSMSKKTKVAALQGLIKPDKKPDADNIAKSILDAINGMAYEDDKQVTQLTVIKRYDSVPRVEVTLESDGEEAWQGEKVPTGRRS